jgi:hypothetical protein
MMKSGGSCGCRSEGENMKVRFGVSVLSGTAFPRGRDLDKFAELVRIIDGSGVELIGCAFGLERNL